MTQMLLIVFVITTYSKLFFLFPDHRQAVLIMETARWKMVMLNDAKISSQLRKKIMDDSNEIQPSEIKVLEKSQVQLF